MFALLFGDQMTSGRVLLNEVKNRLQSVWSLLTSESAGWLAGAIKQCLVKAHSWMIFENRNWGWAGLIPPRLFGCKVMQIPASRVSCNSALKYAMSCNARISIARHSELPRRRRKVCFKEKLLPLFDFSSQTFPPWEEESKKVAESVSLSGDKY